MGYKYGVWYVYREGLFPTKHLGHFTITCFMEKEDAVALYKDLEEKIGKTNMINIDCTNPIVFNKNIYEEDNNELCSWGYNGKVLNWNSIKKITSNFKCNFSQQPHTSIHYSKSEKDLKLVKLKQNQLVSCEMYVVNITSDNPSEWHIIDL
jgi:hypothetical protein